VSVRPARSSRGGRRKSAPPRAIAQSPPDFEAHFPLRRVIDDRSQPALDRAALLRMLDGMILGRELDLALAELHRRGKIPWHATTRGEEAYAAGIAHALRDRDWIIPTHREHAAALVRGVDLERIFAWILERGPDSGFVDRERCIFGSSPLVGTQIAHAAGIGWAMRLRSERAAAVCCFGRAAVSQGDFHTGLNFAGVFGAQTVFLCRSREIAAPRILTAGATVAQRALAYGLRGERVDGGDVLAVLAATREAIERAASGQGATLIEVVISSADPIARLAALMSRLGHSGPGFEKRAHTEAARRVAAAIQ